jgi:hypothetical protein
MTESVYQKARRLFDAGSGWTAGKCDAVLAALEAGEKAEARVRELEMIFQRMTLIKNVGGEGSTIAVIDFPAIEKVLGPEVLGQVSKPKDPK